MCGWEPWSRSRPGGRHGQQLPHFWSVWDTLWQFSTARGPALPENSCYWLVRDVQTSGVSRTCCGIFTLLDCKFLGPSPDSWNQDHFNRVSEWFISTSVFEKCCSRTRQSSGVGSAHPMQGARVRSLLRGMKVLHAMWHGKKFFFKCCSKECFWEISSNIGVLHTEPYLKTSGGRRISKHLSLSLANFYVSFKIFLNISFLATPYLISDKRSLLLPRASHAKFYHLIYHVAL